MDPFAASDDPWVPRVAEPRKNLDEGLRRLTLKRASQIVLRATLWLWDQRIPVGALTLIAGREGIGKSTFAYKLVADVTRGLMPGRYKSVPKSVLIVATEDSWSQTIVPRLMAAGADLDRVFRVDAFTADGMEAQPSLPRDLKAVEALLEEEDAALILLDPLMSRLSESLDTHKDADVRLALEPLVAMADRLGCAVLGLIHLSKGHGTDPLTLIMGSRAFAAVARAVLFVMRDPEDDNLRMVGQEKNNLGKTDLPVLTFSIDSEHVGDTDEGPITTGKLRWVGESSRTIREALESASDAPDHRTVVSEAGDWLVDYLTTEGGEADNQDILAAGKKAGHGPDALKRARTRLRIRSSSYGFPRRTQWSLPDGLAQSEQPSQSTHGENALTALTALTEPTGAVLRPVSAVSAVGEPPDQACPDCAWPLDSEGHALHCDAKGPA
jgi:hypothetical protein